MKKESFQHFKENAIQQGRNELLYPLSGQASQIAAIEHQEAGRETCLSDQALEELVESFWDDKVGRQELLASPKKQQNPNVGGNFIKTEPSAAPSPKNRSNADVGGNFNKTEPSK